MKVIDLLNNKTGETTVVVFDGDQSHAFKSSNIPQEYLERDIDKWDDAKDNSGQIIIRLCKRVGITLHVTEQDIIDLDNSVRQCEYLAKRDVNGKNLEALNKLIEVSKEVVKFATFSLNVAETQQVKPNDVIADKLGKALAPTESKTVS